MTEEKSLIEKIGAEFEEFKSVHRNELTDLAEKGAARAEVTEQFEKVNATLSDLDEKLQAIQLKATRPPVEEESKSGVRNDETHTTEYKSAFNQFCVGGDNSLTPEQKSVLIAGQKALSSGDNPSGGYLMPVEWAQGIIKGVTEISPLRALASVRQTSMKQVKHPRRTSIPTATWEGETQSATSSNSAYASEDLTVHKLRVKTLVSAEALEDNAYNLEQEIISDATEAFAKAEGTAFILGTGSNQPEGIMVNADVGSTTGTGTSGSLDEPDDLISVWGSLDESYDANSTWGMRKATLAAIRKLQTSTGEYLFNVGNLAAGVNNTILGQPYVLMPDVAAIAASAKVLFYGDIRAAYQIVDRVQIEVQRDDFSAGDTDEITFRLRKRVTGAVKLAEAVKVLTLN